VAAVTNFESGFWAGVLVTLVVLILVAAIYNIGKIVGEEDAQRQQPVAEVVK
jgi:Na+-transporting methylmalonyl-CoA/oxaloacetate decarboxylase gamma subunit